MTPTLRGRYGALLLILLGTLLAQPFLGAGRVAEVFLDFTFLAVFMVTIPSIWHNRKLRLVAITLGIFAVLSSTTGRSLGVDSIYPLGAGARAVFFAALIYIIFSDILRRPQINMDAVFGACCVYVLLGISWSAVYSLLEWVYPGSFHFTEFAGSASFGATTTSFKLEYFSLITMTSVGYGEIVPVSPPAQMTAALQALFGQLYLAIIIGRLVGLAVRKLPE